MTEENFISRIVEQWPQNGQSPTPELLKDANEGITEYPSSSILHYLRGDLYQLEHGPGSDSFNPNVVLEFYRRASLLDEENPEPLIEMGYLYDVYFDAFEEAERAFRKAIALGADHSAYVGLARVLAETGRTDEAYAVLNADRCPFSGHSDVADIKQEIGDGMWDPTPRTQVELR